MRSSSAPPCAPSRPRRSAPILASCHGIALGRKSWLFAGSDRGGERAAAMYTLIVTANLPDIEDDEPPYRLLAGDYASLANG